MAKVGKLAKKTGQCEEMFRNVKNTYTQKYYNVPIPSQSYPIIGTLFCTFLTFDQEQFLRHFLFIHSEVESKKVIKTIIFESKMLHICMGGGVKGGFGSEKSHVFLMAPKSIPLRNKFVQVFEKIATICFCQS